MLANFATDMQQYAVSQQVGYLYTYLFYTVVFFQSGITPERQLNDYRYWSMQQIIKDYPCMCWSNRTELSCRILNYLAAFSAAPATSVPAESGLIMQDHRARVTD